MYRMDIVQDISTLTTVQKSSIDRLCTQAVKCICYCVCEALSKNEKDLIRNNLGLSILELSKNIKIHTYEELKNIVAADALELNNLYLISDFQTIYKSGDKVLGYTGSEYESKTYSILLQPVTNSTFNKQATIIPDVLREEDLYLAEWVIEYDFKDEPFEVGDSIIYSKGKITYLKDHNNNSAYYDFHNIKFERNGEFLTKIDKYFAISSILALQKSLNQLLLVCFLHPLLYCNRMTYPLILL